jgi:hypothetical protein
MGSKDIKIGTLVNVRPWAGGSQLPDRRLGLVAEGFGDDWIVWFYSMNGAIENGVTAQPFRYHELDHIEGTVLNVELGALRRAERTLRAAHRFPELYGHVSYMLDDRGGI